MQHKCRACGCEQECEETAEEAGVPSGWFVRHIEYDDYVLCDICGNVSHFRGGLSPYLQDRLGLDDTVEFDVSIEVAAARQSRRAHRKRG